MKYVWVGLLFFFGCSLKAYALVDTTGKWSIGGRSTVGLGSPVILVSKADDSLYASPATWIANGGTGLFAVRYGFSEHIMVSGFMGLNFQSSHYEGFHNADPSTSGNQSFNLNVGAQLDYTLVSFENSRLSGGFSVFVQGIGQTRTYKSGEDLAENSGTTTPNRSVFSLAPSLNYEYFLTPGLSIVGSLAIPVSFAQTQVKSLALDEYDTVTGVVFRTAFEPLVGVYYYF